MNTIETLKRNMKSRSDALVIECLIETEKMIETAATVEDAQTYKIVRCALIETLEDRNPEACAAMDEWALALDDPRSYSEALLDAIKGA